MFARDTIHGMARLAGGALLAASMATGAAAQSYPSEDLEWTIAFGPGGGNDIMSRTLIEIIEKYDWYPADISAENRAGGSGAVGWGYLYAKSGSAYDISTTSGSFITTPLQADLPWGPETFTPIALLATDDLVLVVNSDSPYQTIEDFIAGAKENPPIIGGTGTVNVDFIVNKLFAEAAGYEFEYVSFNAMGEQKTALLSKALDAMVANPSEAIGLIESGDIRPLVYSGDATPDALGDVPTMGDVGYPIGISMPRGLVLAPDAPQEAQDWWIATMKKVVETPEFAEYIEKNQLTRNVKFGDEFMTSLKSTQDGFAKILREQGVIE
ncbi:MAG: tripartite tricarboxylate transporter substrate-binding protein [Pseudomonadota bacterium]